MGRDKLSLEVGGVPLIRRVHDVLASVCDEVLVVGEDVMSEVEARRLKDLRENQQGPLAGMEAGITAARFPIVFVAAGDMPFLKAGMVGHLLRGVAGRGIRAAVPLHGGKIHPLCAAYDRTILPEVTRALDEGVRATWELLSRLEGVEYVENELGRFGDPDLLLMNVNTQEDLEIARRALQSSGWQ